MTAPVAWTDPTALQTIRRDAHQDGAAALRQVAQQFESLFVRMMLQSMREASSGDPLFDSEEGGFYRDMFDDQIAVDMSAKGSLGLADLLVRQLSQVAGTAGAPATTSPRSDDAPTRELRTDFVRRMWPLAVEAGRALGVDPRHVIAQSALETGWGRHASGHNHFGIKAGGDWNQGVVSLDTREFEQGLPRQVTADFRAYPDARASVMDYVKLLGGQPRYASVRGTGSDIEAFGLALQRAGYATDPQYAAKLRSTAAAVAELLRDRPVAADLKIPADRPITGSQSAA